MPTSFKILLYQYNELTPPARAKARLWYERVVSEDTWWDSVCTDLNECGVFCSCFDLDRRDINIVLRYDFLEAAKALYQLYELDFCKNYDASVENAENNFKTKLEIFVLKLLQAEYDSVTSTEYIEEGIKANEYWFDKNGDKVNEVMFTKIDEV